MSITQTADKLRVARFDPRAIVPAGSTGTDEKTPTIAVFAGPLSGKSTLYFAPSQFAIGNEVPKDALALAETRAFDQGEPPHAAVGIDDEEGMLAWVELPPNVTPSAETRKQMAHVLDQLGCRVRAAIVSSHVLLGGSLDPAGDPVPPATGTVARLVRVVRPAARLYYDTPPVGPGTWMPLQMQRVRYFNRPKPVTDAGAPDAQTP
jgi:hypothetical protein